MIAQTFGRLPQTSIYDRFGEDQAVGRSDPPWGCEESQARLDGVVPVAVELVPLGYCLDTAEVGVADLDSCRVAASVEFGANPQLEEAGVTSSAF